MKSKLNSNVVSSVVFILQAATLERTRNSFKKKKYKSLKGKSPLSHRISRAALDLFVLCFQGAQMLTILSNQTKSDFVDFPLDLILGRAKK